MNIGTVFCVLLIIGIVFGKDRLSRRIRNTIILFLCLGIALSILEWIGILR